jgi:O-6-methylguanine DNA methyltransferase
VEVIRYAVDGWGVGEVRIADGRVVWHDLPRAGLPLSDEPRTGNGRVPFLSPHPGGADNPPPSRSTIPRKQSRIRDDFVEVLLQRLHRYFAGEAVDFDDVPLDLDHGTPFLTRCAAALRAVPRGDVVTYGELAALAGAPGAARAAGSFCARNRLALFVPCHRVVAAGGLGSYGSYGADYKRRLLALEHAVL